MTTDQILVALEARGMWAEGPRPVEALKADWEKWSARFKAGDDPGRYARWRVHRLGDDLDIGWIQIVAYGDTLREAASEAIGEPMF